MRWDPKSATSSPAVTLRRKAARGVLWTALGNWGYELSAFAVFAILANILTPNAFGIIALATVFTAFTRILSEQGLADAIVQRQQIDDRDLDTAFWANLAVAVVLAGTLAAISPSIASAVGQPDLGPVLAWMSLTLVFSALGSVQLALLRRELTFASLTVRQLVAVVAGGVAGIAAAFSGLGVWSLVIQNLVTSSVSSVALWIVGDWRPRFRFSPSRFKTLASFGMNVLGFRTMLFFTRRTDDLLIGYYLGAAALGLYTVGYRLLRLVTQATTNIIASVAFPVFSRLQDDRESVLRAYYKAIELTSVLAFPAFVGIALTAPELVELMFGSRWASSVPVMRILAVAGLAQSVLFAPGVAMKALGKPSWRLGITTLTAVTAAVAFFIAVRSGIVAVAGAFVVVVYALAPVTLWAARKLVGSDHREMFRRVVPPFVATSVMAAGVLAVRLVVDDLALVLRLIVLVASGAALYTATLWTIANSVTREILDLARMALTSDRSEAASGD